MEHIIWAETGFNSDFYYAERTKKLKKSLKADVDCGMHFTIQIPIVPEGWNLPIGHIIVKDELARTFAKANPNDYTKLLNELIGKKEWQSMVDEHVIQEESKKDEDDIWAGQMFLAREEMDEDK